MRVSLKSLTKKAKETYGTIKRTEWVTKYPGMVTLAGDQIHWTADVEQAIADVAQGGLD